MEIITQENEKLLLKDLCARLPYGVKCCIYNFVEDTIRIKEDILWSVQGDNVLTLKSYVEKGEVYTYHQIKPYLFPLSSMTDEDHATYSKIWEDTGKTAYLEGCHHLICTIKAYKAANDYLLSKHYDTDGLIPKGLAIDATGLNIY